MAEKAPRSIKIVENDLEKAHRDLEDAQKTNDMRKEQNAKKKIEALNEEMRAERRAKK